MGLTDGLIQGCLEFCENSTFNFEKEGAMTALSERMKDKICQYCGRQDGKHCLADVPYYAVSLNCNSFTESKIEEKPKRKPSMKRIMKKTLVETF
jgi:hypothetical protein